MNSSLVFRIARVGLIVAVGAIAAEVTTRLDDWARFGVPFSSNIVALDELLITDSVGVHARPNSQFRQFRINSLGFRGGDISKERVANVPLVVVSGASESFGLYESMGQEWPRQLEDSLSTICKRDIYVGNAAFAGMSLPTVAQDVLGRLAPLSPAAIVYYPTPMQYLESKIPVAAKPNLGAQASSSSPPRFRFPSRIRDAVKRTTPPLLLDLLRQREIAASRRASTVAAQDHAPLQRLDAFEFALRNLVGNIKAVGALPMLVVHQNRFYMPGGVEQARWLRAWERFYPLYTGKAILEFDRLAAQRTRLVAQDSGVLLVDPAPLLQIENPVPFADFSHFTDRGAAVVSGTVARALAPQLCIPR